MVAVRNVPDIHTLMKKQRNAFLILAQKIKFKAPEVNVKHARVIHIQTAIKLSAFAMTTTILMKQIKHANRIHVINLLKLLVKWANVRNALSTITSKMESA